jgi:hypothetical protein
MTHASRGRRTVGCRRGSATIHYTRRKGNVLTEWQAIRPHNAPNATIDFGQGTVSRFAWQTSSEGRTIDMDARTPMFAKSGSRLARDDTSTKGRLTFHVYRAHGAKVRMCHVLKETLQRQRRQKQPGHSVGGSRGEDRGRADCAPPVEPSSGSDHTVNEPCLQMP